ncbi:MAG TPA: cell wall hydrolase [Bacillota bacterium]|nr:cell wall hydrolase [Bacillota bacterium]HPT87133.1 cell wall hydrolase [Bacillota bacterium]
MTKKVLSSLMAFCIFSYSVVIPSVVIFDSGTDSSRQTAMVTVKEPVKTKTLTTVQPPQQTDKTTEKPATKTNQTAMTNPTTVAVTKANQPATPATVSTKSAEVSTTASKTTTPKTVLSAKEYTMLVRIISAEAKGEPLQGQVAVGAVILNRIKSGKFPKTVTANVLKKGEFEPVSNGQIWNEPVASAYKAAQLALKGWDPTYGALYFYNPAKTSSKWIRSRTTIIQIGDHVFAA